MAYLNYSSPIDGAPYDAQFTMNANGAGTVSLSGISGYYVTSNATTGAGATVAVSQGNTSVTYSPSNGAMVLNFPTLSQGTSTELLSGGKGGNYLYFSPDGNFVFGGSAGNTNLQADMFVGVKTGGAAPLLSSPLYYNAGAFLPVSSGGYDIDTYYGSISLSSGVDILHSRLFSAGVGGAFDTVTTGTAPTIGSADIAQSVNFPTKLNGVQVLIDEIPAPLYYVSANQIAAIVPYEVTQYPANFVNVQVNNNGQLSHTISEFLSVGTPGVFTNPADGLGLAAAEHADGTLITENSPAQPGESIAVYLTGLGEVIPPIQDGTPGISSAPYNQTFNTIYAAIDGPTSSTQASVPYAGLAPTLTGLYQVNLTIPAGVTAGDNFLEIDVLDSAGNPLSTSEEAIIPIGSGGTPGVSPVRPEIENGQTYKANRSRIGKPLKTHVAIKPVQP
jgi:uncharacterized protein (TIGR03437 family)